MRGGKSHAVHPGRSKDLLSVLLICALWPAAAEAQDSPASFEPELVFGDQTREAVILTQGAPLTAAGSANETFVYVFVPDPNARYLVEVEQSGLDIIVTARSPSGTSIAFDSPLARDDREVVLLESADRGAYTLTLHSREHTGAVGSHSIRVSRLDDAAPAEIEAWRAMSDAAAANFEGGEAEWQRALASYERAADLWRLLGRERELAHALYSAAMIAYGRFSAWARAERLAAAAADLYARLDEEALSANAVHLRAAALIETHANPSGDQLEHEARFDEARELFEDARRVHLRLGNQYELGLIANNLGLLYFYMGDLEQAKTFAGTASALLRELDEWEAELKPSANAASFEGLQGFLLSAVERLEGVVRRWPDEKEPAELAMIVHNLAANHRLLGNLDAALQNYSAALTMHREEGNRLGEARALLGIGQAYLGLNELDLAAQYLHQALPMVQDLDDGRGHEAVVRSLGNIAFLNGDPASALEQHRAAAALAGSALDVAHLQVLQARDLAALGRHTEALHLAAEARAAAETLGARQLYADALRELGRARVEIGEIGAGEADLKEALATYDALKLSPQQADALNALARAARAGNDLESALDYGEASLRQVESLRGRIADPALRALHSALHRSYYDMQIDLLMEARQRAHTARAAHDYLGEAFSVSDRSRGRMLADLLSEASVDLRRGIDPELFERRTRLYERLAEARSRRDQWLAEPMAADSPEQETIIVEELASLENQLNLVEMQMRRANPRYASVSKPEPAQPAEIQRLIGQDTTLLQYALGEARSYVWVISETGIDAVELAPRHLIETAARQAVEALRSYSARPTEGEASTLAALSALVLEPVRHLVSDGRLVIVPDGALHYVPFGVLPSPDATAWLHEHEIVIVPSASALAAQARRTATEPSRSLAAFADPVFDDRDARVAEIAGRRARESGGQAASTSGASAVARLPYSGREVSAIASLFPGDALVATGFEASRERLLDTDLAEYRYLHFATHGQVDARYPALSALALSRLDERGEPQDGNLRLHDIYNLELNADLVVLSACETALGREIDGGGLAGFATGFMYAGARALVVSLWQAPDAATAELMTRFYAGMLRDGLAPPEALRQAQLSVASEPMWEDPFFWGAFVLLGDWT